MKPYKDGSVGSQNDQTIQRKKLRRKKYLRIKLALLFSIVSLFGFGQYERNLDSIAKANINVVLNHYQDSLIFLSTNPYKRLKLTVSARVNDNLNFSNIEHFTIHDYFNLGVYDVRLRYYITHDIKIFQRVLITGLDESNYFFTTGIVKWF